MDRPFNQEQINRGRDLSELMVDGKFSHVRNQINDMKEAAHTLAMRQFGVDTAEYRGRYNALSDLMEWIDDEIELGAAENRKKNDLEQSARTAKEAK